MPEAAVAQTTSPTSVHRPVLRASWAAAGLVGVFLAAVLLRFPLLATIPVGLHYDEAWSGIDAATVTWTHLPVFFTDSNGMEPAYLYLQALSMAVFGRTPFALRVVSAVLGTATVLALYLLMRRMAGSTTALFAAAVLAVTYWDVHVSRLGYRAVMLPLFECLAWWALWMGTQRHSARWLVLGGAFVGMSLYTYSTARAFPLAVTLWFGWLAVRELNWRRIAQLILVGVAALVVFAPLGLYFLHNPDAFLNRVGQVVVLSPTVSGNNPNTVLTGVIKTLGMFSVHGDPQWKYNLSGKPIFDPLMSAGLYAGAVLCIWLMVQRRGRASVASNTSERDAPQRPGVTAAPAELPPDGAALLLIWFVVMIIPGMITTDPPETLHTFATVPVVCTLPAVGFLALWALFKRRWPLPNHTGAALATALIVAEGIATAISYFVIWAPNPQTYYWLHGDVADLAYRLESEPASVQLYVATEYLKHPTIVFLAPDALPRITWFDARKGLPVHQSNAPAVYAFAHTFDVPPEASAALQGAALDAPKDSAGDIRYHWYRLPVGAAAAPLPTPLRAQLGNIVQLQDVYVHIDPAQPRVVRVALRWKVLAVPTAKLSVFVHLLDAAGHRWGQEDGLGYFTSDWQAGDEVYTVETVTVPPGTPPASLTVTANLYDVDSGTVLPVSAAPGTNVATDSGLVVGHVTPPPTDASLLAAVPGKTVPVTVADGLNLVGVDIPSRSVTAGSGFETTLYYQKVGAQVRDPKLSLAGVQATDSEPVPAAALLDQLPVGSIIGVRHLLLISGRAGSQTASLTLTGNASTINFGTVAVQALDRQTTLGTPSHPLTVRFGSVAELRGYDLVPAEMPLNGPVTLTLYWQALGSPDVAYTVFTHLVGPDGKLHGQHDGPPAGGIWPTTLWLPGQVIVDTHPVDVQAAVGPLTFQIGLYDPVTGARLPTSGPAGTAADSYATLGPLPSASQP